MLGVCQSQAFHDRYPSGLALINDAADDRRHPDGAMAGEGSGSTDAAVPVFAVSADRNGCCYRLWLVSSLRPLVPTNVPTALLILVESGL